ncbi:MAG: glycoside hydrolase family 3 N-terminal domain-containing protein [Pontibacterium sp.]
MIKLFISVLLCFSIFWALHFNDPHLLAYRPYELSAFIALNLFILWLCVRLHHKVFRASVMLVVLCCAASVVWSVTELERFKQSLERGEQARFAPFNKRLIVGYKTQEDAVRLARNGVAGLFLTKRNISGQTKASLTQFIAELQTIRHKAGLPPLIITSDQEGGPVSRLSPLVPSQPSLATVIDDPSAAYNYGKVQGKWLADLGITVNFSPVVDLKPNRPPGQLDFHSLIATRAISSDPSVVVRAARDYINGLAESGVGATLKHFPGLARVQEDTHHFSALLDIHVDELTQTDLKPFVEISQTTDAWLMLSHVIWTQVDDQNPVSTSRLVVNDFIRNRLGIRNTLVTDDLTMAATYNRGFCKSVKQAYEADIDYLLIAYDDEKYFVALKCLSEGKIKNR